MLFGLYFLRYSHYQGEQSLLKVLKKKHRVHSLTGRITASSILKAFKSVRKNRGAAGLDKQTIGMFEANLAENLAALLRKLKDRTYLPIPLLRKFIYKEKNKEFKLTRILVSHCHPDHFSGLKRLRKALEIKVSLTKKSAEIIKNKKSYTGKYLKSSRKS